MSGRVAALFVEEAGIYSGRPDVDVWGISRDARKYAGPWPVVAHPPCERWGRYAGPRKGQDDGCFAAALDAVRKYGGVLEHPAESAAWKAFGLTRPLPRGFWYNGDGTWVCCVEQGHYGHRARKRTWLLASGFAWPGPPNLAWGPSVVPLTRKGREATTDEERLRARRTGVVQNLSRKQRRATPPAFAELLLSIARSCASPGSARRATSED